MMECHEMLTTLIVKNPDDEASRVSDVSVAGKNETFGVGRVVDELDNDVSDVNSVRVSVEEEIKEVGVCDGHGAIGLAKEEGNLEMSSENGKECVDKGCKCSEIGVELPGIEHAVCKIKDAAVVIESLKGLEDVPVQHSDIGGNVTKHFEAMEIQMAQLTDEEQPSLLKEDVKVAVSDDDFLVKKQIHVRKDCSFAIGDIVWCMSKNNIWWPALICDPSDVLKKSTKNWDSERHLVRHFGSKISVWCQPSHLKHFLESFKEMSSQGKSKNFLGAIEKASEEVGRRVKLEMSCSCMSNEVRARLIGRNKEDFKPWYVSNVTVALHFDPSKFLERVKSLAVMSNVLDIVETIATRSYISAYYSYFGHSQMYLRHLRDTDVPNGDTTAEECMIVVTENTEAGCDLGIEKDCQFLDSSTMDESPKLSTEGSAEKGFESRERKKSKYLSFPFVDPIATKSLRDLTDLSEPSAKRSSSSGKRLLGKSSRKLAATTSGDLKDLKVSPAQLLTELHDTSRGYFYLNGNTILKSTFDFFCEFRRHTFNDGDSASNCYAENGIFDMEALEIQDATPLSEIKPGKKRKKYVTGNLEACRGKFVEKVLIKNRKRKEFTGTDHQTNKTAGVLDSISYGSSRKPHKNPSDKEEVTEANSPQKKTKSELQNVIIKAKPISLVVDLSIDSHSLAGLLDANVESHFGDTPAIPSLPELPSSAGTSSALPDLNGTSVTSPSPEQSVQADMIPVPATHPAARDEEPHISVIKSNLEMMTKMLEESGDNISPDMRAKLENDVKGLLKKITDVAGSSS